MQKELENYYKSYTKGLRNAERARKFIQKTLSKECNYLLFITPTSIHGHLKYTLPSRLATS